MLASGGVIQALLIAGATAAWLSQRNTSQRCYCSHLPRVTAFGRRVCKTPNKRAIDKDEPLPKYMDGSNLFRQVVSWTQGPGLQLNHTHCFYLALQFPLPVESG